MHWLRRLARVFFRRDDDAAVDAELRQHVELEIEDLVRSGVPRDEATRQARARSPFSSSSLKTGTNAPERAASATSARTRLGIWNAMVNALIGPRAPK